MDSIPITQQIMSYTSSADIVIIVTDKNGLIQWTNKEFVELTAVI